MKSLAGWVFAVFLAGTMFGQWIGDNHARYVIAKSGSIHYGRISYECARKRKTSLPDMEVPKSDQKSFEASQ